MTFPFDVDLQAVEDEGYRAFGGYVEPGDDGWVELLSARDVMLERLMRARSQQARIALGPGAAVHGLVVEVDDADDGGWAS